MVQIATVNAGHDRRRAAATGQRLANAAFVHAQTNMLAIHNLHESNVDPLREKPDAPPAAAPPSPPAPAPHRRNVRPHADCPAPRLGILLSCRPDWESRKWR